MMLFKYLLFSIFTFVCLFVLPPIAKAAQNFTTDYHVVYSIHENGSTTAVVNVTLTNTTTQFYASSYKMQIGFDDITNLSAKDGKGEIIPQAMKNADGYLVEIPFNQKSVGLGSKQDFILTFDTNKLARHYGKIWEIDIPGITNPNEFSQFTVELKVPSSFGTATYIKPKQASNSLVFSKETLGRSGISLAFGDKQIYTYKLTYHLKNPNLFPITTDVALPPTTNYQTVSLENLNPRPINVVQDKDGNWIAKYHLLSAQSLDIVAQGKVLVQLQPKKVLLSEVEKSEYTKEAKYWESNSDKIREIADELKTPQAIYQYVVNTLQYDFKRVTQDSGRLGALGSIQHPKSVVCREYTDLFIALARAAGIPAREVDGFAYTENVKQRPLSQEKDILHVWPEYYDSEKQTWIMVDPTWGSTTGGVDYFDVNDFAHVAFVIKGLSSEKPLPAGAYKYENNRQSKDVEVAFTYDDFSINPSVSIASILPKLASAGFALTGKVQFTNTSNVYLPSNIASITSLKLLPSTQTVMTSGIPPFGSLEVPIKFNATSLLTNEKYDYTIQFAGATKTFSVSIVPFFMTPIGGGILGGFFTLIILIVTIKSRRVHLSRRK